MRASALAQGLACALAAGLLWGLVFIAPLLLPQHPPAALSIARYLAFGVVALPLALADRRALSRLSTADWREALALSLVGNLLYYGFLAAAIQRAGAPLPTMIIGTLPVVIAVCANLGERSIAWSRLSLSLGVLGAGIALVHLDELEHLRAGAGGASAGNLWLGALLAAGAAACWTWYPIRNARWLRRHPQVGSGTWATAQGLATLPLALIGLPLVWPGLGLQPLPEGWTHALGPQPAAFIGLMLVIALGASWLGTGLWNRASQLLPTALAGQLIVFETLAALSYAFLLRGALPGPTTLAGVVLLLIGVTLGVQAARSAR